jgi:hypothetical protein
MRPIPEKFFFEKLRVDGRRDARRPDKKKIYRPRLHRLFHDIPEYRAAASPKADRAFQHNEQQQWNRNPLGAIKSIDECPG